MADRLLSLADVARIYANVSTSTIRRMVKRGDRRLPAPCHLHPMQWRQSDIDARLRRLSVATQLQQEARHDAHS